MKDFIIATDSGCDLSYEYCKENNIEPIRIKYTIENYTFEDSMEFDDQIKFYNEMRQGAKPITSQINTMEFVDFWRPFLEEGKAILNITLGSAISGTYNNALNAKEILLEEFPDAQIYVVDSRGASMSIAILVDKAVEMRKAGADIPEIVDWIEKNKHNIHAIYTTDDLTYLNRSGRLSKGSMIVANVLGIRPILKLDYDGHLVAFEKVRGKTAIISRISEIINQLAVSPETQNIYIAHTDAPEFAKEAEEAIFAKTKFSGTRSSQIGATIGAHAGPGLIAIFFIGVERV